MYVYRLKPEALGSIPSGATFLSFPLPFQRSTDSNGPDCLSLYDHCQPCHAVITLTIHYDQCECMFTEESIVKHATLIARLALI